MGWNNQPATVSSGWVYLTKGPTKGGWMQPECSELRLDCAAHDEHEKDRIVSMALTGNMSSHSSQLSGQANASPPLENQDLMDCKPSKKNNLLGFWRGHKDPKGQNWRWCTVSLSCSRLLLTIVMSVQKWSVEKEWSGWPEETRAPSCCRHFRHLQTMSWLRRQDINICFSAESPEEWRPEILVMSWHSTSAMQHDQHVPIGFWHDFGLVVMKRRKQREQNQAVTVSTSSKF